MCSCSLADIVATLFYFFTYHFLFFTHAQTNTQLFGSSFNSYPLPSFTFILIAFYHPHAMLYLSVSSSHCFYYTVSTPFLLSLILTNTHSQSALSYFFHLLNTAPSSFLSPSSFYSVGWKRRVTSKPNIKRRINRLTSNHFFFQGRTEKNK